MNIDKNHAQIGQTTDSPGATPLLTPLQSTMYILASFPGRKIRLSAWEQGYDDVPSLCEARIKVTRTKFFVVNGISILTCTSWNIQLTFEQEGFRCNEQYHEMQKVQGLCRCLKNKRIMANS